MKSASKGATYGEKRDGVAERTILGGKSNDSGSKDADLQRVASKLASGRGSGRGLPPR